ncbi:MAG: ABC transporter ATP-binding protein [Treponema sp.]|jgi:oligopeptide transport system ATP-binding protein|nr:ABC transporter ATP-binding protein [Treponema sp.]
MDEALLQVKDLQAVFRVGKQEYPVLHKLSFRVKKRETVCMVGESGCGKSVTTLAVMGLLPNNGKVSGGSIRLDGQELTGLSRRDWGALRGKKMGMVFQEPMTALNPLLTVGRQLTEGLRLHRGMDKAAARRCAIECLEMVGISNPGERMRQFPFQMSGGLRQRAMIAMVLAVEPELFIADEPTTALDVTIQKQVLVLLNRLKKNMEAGILFITHDLGVVAEIADRVVVLYAGHKVEEGPVREVFQNPRHPYTRGLLSCVPNIDDDAAAIRAIPGVLPNITEDIPGCRFHPRCQSVMDRCRKNLPEELPCGAPGHFVSCFLEREGRQ